MIPVQHPIAGPALHLAADPAAPVGDLRDPERRPHIFRFGGFYIRVLREEGGYRLLPFLTVAQARAAMVRGAYAERRRLSPGLRAPDLLVRTQPALDETPLEGLRYDEALALVQLAGGRIPGERELDFAISTVSGIAGADPWESWTATRWSRNSYSLVLWDETLGRWRAPDHSPSRAADPSRLSCFRFGDGLRRFPGAPDETQGRRCWIVFDE